MSTFISVLLTKEELERIESYVTKDDVYDEVDDKIAEKIEEAKKRLEEYKVC